MCDSFPSDFKTFIVAYLPQITHLDYFLIRRDEKTEATKIYK